MSITLVDIFIVLHGLVHLWYFTLSSMLVAFQPEMGWSGNSWLFSNLLGDATTRLLASVLFVLATIGFVAGGIGILGRQEWWHPVTVGSSALSAAVILLFWDGSMELLVQKWVTGLLIKVAILMGVLVLGWPSSEF